jgi:hypothetical protein
VRVNKTIKKTLSEIAKETNISLNEPSSKRQYVKRLLDVFKRQLTNDEQVSLVIFLLEQLSYKNIVTDPDNMLTIGNVKNRTIFLVFSLTVVVLLLVSYLFSKDSRFTQMVDHFFTAIKFFLGE